MVVLLGVAWGVIGPGAGSHQRHVCTFAVYNSNCCTGFFDVELKDGDTGESVDPCSTSMANLCPSLRRLQTATCYGFVSFGADRPAERIH